MSDFFCPLCNDYHESVTVCPTPRRPVRRSAWPGFEKALAHVEPTLQPVGPAVDYEALLAKYIRHVAICTGRSSDLPPINGRPPMECLGVPGTIRFTADELAELRRLAREGA